jgi:IclR family KDG regulon transcriptional repressor
MRTPTPVKMIDRLVNVLDCFSLEQPVLSLTQLSQWLDEPKSNIFRLLVSLESHGIVRRDTDTNGWRLGYRLYLWGDLAGKGNELRDVARAAMQDLARATNETTVLAVYDNREVLYIAKVDTSHSVRLALEVGQRKPIHAGACSKVLMANLPKEEIEAILEERGLPKLCTNTIIHRDRLRAELAQIRQQGYARSFEEMDIDTWGVATPIRDRHNQVVAAIGVVGPALRFASDLAERYVELSRLAADRISALITTGIPPGSGKLQSR